MTKRNDHKIKRKINQKIIAMFLICSMILEAFSGCSNSKKTENDTVVSVETSGVSASVDVDTVSTDRCISVDALNEIASSNTSVVEIDKKTEGLIQNIESAVGENDYESALNYFNELEELDSQYSETVTSLSEVYSKAKVDLAENLSPSDMEVFEERKKSFFDSLSRSKDDYDQLKKEIKEAISAEDNFLIDEKMEALSTMLYPQEEIYGGCVEDIRETGYHMTEAVMSSRLLSSEDPSLLDVSGAVALNDNIKAIADRLGSALEVYNYVKNSVDFTNYSGLRKGAVATYDSKIGNDVDQATLLVGMLRYLGYPAGYKTGYIKIDEETAKNLTGADSLPTAANIFAAMGENVSLINVNGKPAYIKKEHTWVSAYVPYTEYRGSGPAAGEKIWVDLDTSIKRYVDSLSFYDSFKSYYPTDFDMLPDVMTGESAEALYDGIEVYYDDAEKFYTDSVGKEDIVLACGKNTIEQNHESYLPLSLQYETITESEVYASVENVSDTISFMFGWDDDICLKTYDLYNKRLTIEYEGATDYDRNMIRSYGNVLNLLPGEYYVVPVLKIDGQAVLRGPETRLGSKQALTINVSSGILSRKALNNLTAGSMYSIVTDLQTITYQQGKDLRADIDEEIDKIESRWFSDESYLEDEYNCDKFYSEEEMGLLLQQAGIYYFSKLDGYMMLMAEDDNVYANRFTSLGMTGYEVNVNSLLGNRVSINSGNFITDIDFNNMAVISLDDNDFNKLSYMLKMGTMSSQMESIIWKDMFDVEAVSTIEIFNQAYKDGIEILKIDQTNIDSINSFQINVSAKNDITEAVGQGYEIYIPEKNVDICGKKWTGYMVLDPLSNSGRYMITGGHSGAETISIDDIDMDMAKAESDWYLYTQKVLLPIVSIAAIKCIKIYGDTSVGKTLGYFLLAVQTPFDYLRASYVEYKQDKLYEAYINGDEQSGIEFYKNMRAEAIVEFVMALGYLVDFVDILLDGRIAKAIAKLKARRAAEKEAAREASKGIAREIGGDFVEHEITEEIVGEVAEHEATKEVAEEIAEKEVTEKVSKETAEEVLENESLKQEKEIVDEIAEGEYEKAGCFVAGTFIKTDKGNKPIEEISLGDMVYSYDPITGDTGYKKVRRLYIHDAYSLIKLTVNGEEVVATENHPFYVNGYGFESADEILVGDKLQKADGSTVEVEETELIHYKTPVKVYNLEVEDWHTYYVMDESVLVHNMCTAKTPAERASDKGYKGIGTTPNGGADFAGSGYVYKNSDGKEVIVKIKMTGGRGTDFTKAFDAANIPSKLRKSIRENYTWHHLDDFDPVTKECTMQLVLKDAHVATYPHKGSVAQYEKYFNVKYR